MSSICVYNSYLPSRFVRLATSSCYRVTMLPSPSLQIEQYLDLATTLDIPLRISTSSYSPPYGPLKLDFDLAVLNHLDSRTLFVKGHHKLTFTFTPLFLMSLADFHWDDFHILDALTIEGFFHFQDHKKWPLTTM